MIFHDDQHLHDQVPSTEHHTLGESDADTLILQLWHELMLIADMALMLVLMLYPNEMLRTSTNIMLMLKIMLETIQRRAEMPRSWPRR